MELSSGQIGTVTVVRCRGRLVHGDESENFHHVVKSLIQTNPRVLLNLAEVSYVDSGGLGVLFALRTSAQSAGGHLVLASPSQRLLDLLNTTRLITVFDVCDSEEAGIRCFH